MSLTTENSPLFYLNVHKKVWKFFGAFELETDSLIIKNLMKIYTFCYPICFIYVGVIIQTLAVINSNSIDEAIQIFFISFAYANAGIKTFIFYLHRKQLQELWAKLEDSDYKIVNMQEYR